MRDKLLSPPLTPKMVHATLTCSKRLDLDFWHSHGHDHMDNLFTVSMVISENHSPNHPRLLGQMLVATGFFDYREKHGELLNMHCVVVSQGTNL